METLTIKDYVSRIADAEISEHLQAFGAVVIEGPKWCGKTTTAKKHAVSEISMADPSNDFQARRLAGLDPALVLEGAQPRLIDEWQDVPKLWDAVRFECDQSNQPGQFILTGSSSPKKRKSKDADQPRHSGAGRMVRIPMSTMTQLELGQSSGVQSLAALFDGAGTTATSLLTLNRVAELAVSGGWPQARGRSVRSAALIAKGYLQAVINEDIHEVDGIEHNKEKVQRLIGSLARNEATLAGNKTLLRDARGPDPVGDAYDSYHDRVHGRLAQALFRARDTSLVAKRAIINAHPLCRQAASG